MKKKRPITMPLSGMSTTSEEEAVTVSEAAGVVAWEIVKGIAAVAPLTPIDTSAISEMVGAVATAFTVTTNVIADVRDPSLAVTVMVVAPT